MRTPAARAQLRGFCARQLVAVRAWQAAAAADAADADAASYARLVALPLAQLDGLAAGYAASAPAGTPPLTALVR